MSDISTTDETADNTADETTQEAPLVTLTERAATEALDRIKSWGDLDIVRTYLRLWVSGGGCSGLQYGLALDEGTDENDILFLTKQGVPMAIDTTSARYVAGSVIDWQDTPMGGGFKVENPQSVKGCGCGSSFTVEDADALGIDNSRFGSCNSCPSTKTE